MTEIRHFAGWLRSLAGLAALAGVFTLSACGGGSGAPNNSLQRPLEVQPTTTVVYSGVPSLLSITRGTGPFRATSSNPGVLPVAQSVAAPNILLLANNVLADTSVTVTIEDLAPSAAAVFRTATVAVTVSPAPLLNSFTIIPNLADCGTAVCSGQTATAKVTVLGPTGGPVAGHAIRFDVIGTSYAIVSNNPAQPLVSSLTVFSDSTGVAAVVIKANANAPTQAAQMSVTDLTSGQQLIGNFTILQVTDGSQILSVVPDEANIKGAFKGVCSSGFAIDYFIYGGTPPYRITSTFPQGVTLVNSIVNTNGGFFEAITNGTCVDPLIFSIVDATGRQTTAQLHNVEGDSEAPTVTPPALAASPDSITDPACTGKSFNFVIFGGTAPYNVKPTAGTATPQTVSTSGGSTLVSGLLTGSGTTTIVFLDSSSPQKSDTSTIDCP